MAEDLSASDAARLPNFIEDVAASQDAFGAHGRIAKAIAQLIASNNGFKVIGLLGPWGSGKSTVARLIESEVKKTPGENDTLFFCYDTWMHQSDPPRRAFLEAFIYFLIHHGLTKKAMWANKLDELNRRTEATETTSTPTLTSAGRLVGLSLLLVPVGLPFVGYEWFSASYGNNWLEHLFHIELPSFAKLVFPIALGLTAAPLLVCLGIYIAWRPWTAAPLRSGRFWLTHRAPHADESILSIFANKEVSRSKTTISRGVDPTAIEFQITFRDIIKQCSNEKQRFVFIVDNLDRLPETDAIGMWSTIRSFFLGGEDLAGEDTEANRPLIILPIDERAVSRMYAAKNMDPKLSEDLAQSFMDKTFDLTFRVPPPVLSDWSGYFESQIKTVFGDQISEDDVFNTTIILRNYIDSNPTLDVTPRYINTLINLIATIWMQWGGQIPFASIGYFCVHRARIDAQLLAELGTPKAGIDNIDPNWQQSIAAMHYGVANLSDALQIVMDAPLTSAIARNDPAEFERLSAVKGFHLAFLQTLERAAGDQSALSDPQFALFGSALLDTLSNPPTMPARRQRVQLRRIFTGASTWKSFDLADPALVAAFLAKVTRTDARNVAASLADKLSAVDAAQLAAHKANRFFVETTEELARYCRANGLSTIKVTVPGDAKSYLQILISLKREKFILEFVSLRGTDSDLQAQLLQGLATKESAAFFLDQLEALIFAETQVDYGPVADQLVQAIVDRPVTDFAVLPAINALGLLCGHDQKVAIAAKARVDNGQFASVLTNAVTENLVQTASQLLAVMIVSKLSAAVPVPQSGSWSDLIAREATFISNLDTAIRRFGGDATLNLIVDAGTVDPGLAPVAKALFTYRIEQKNLGSLFIEPLIKALPRYTAYVDAPLLSEFNRSLTTYDGVWTALAEAPISEPTVALIVSQLAPGEAGSSRAIEASKEQLAKVSEADWISAITGGGVVCKLAAALAKNNAGALPIGGELNSGLEEMAKTLIQGAAAETIARWFEATGWVSAASSAVLFMNLRDVLLSGAADARALPTLVAAPADFLERAKFEDKADDAIRHVVLPLLSEEAGRTWLSSNAIRIKLWIERSAKDGPARAALIERLSGTTEPVYQSLADQWELPLHRPQGSQAPESSVPPSGGTTPEPNQPEPE